jgi:hypothetical protein
MAHPQVADCVTAVRQLADKRFDITFVIEKEQ